MFRVCIINQSSFACGISSQGTQNQLDICPRHRHLHLDCVTQPSPLRCQFGHYQKSKLLMFRLLAAPEIAVFLSRISVKNLSSCLVFQAFSQKSKIDGKTLDNLWITSDNSCSTSIYGFSKYFFCFFLYLFTLDKTTNCHFCFDQFLLSCSVNGLYSLADYF